MKKRVVWFVSLMILCMACSTLASAADHDGSRLADYAALLTGGERQELHTKLDAASERLQFDIVVVTTDDLGGKSCMDFADDFYDDKGYGFGDTFDGALLLISMEPNNRMCWISTCGFGETAITDAGITYFLDDIVDNGLARGDCYYAVDTFIDLCDRFVTQARTGNPYDGGNMPRDRLGIGTVVIWLIAAVAVGAVFGGLYTAVLKSNMKTVRMQRAADAYVRDDSLRITAAHEIFLYKNVVRKKRESSNGGGGGSSTHTASSGRSHGGGGRSF